MDCGGVMEEKGNNVTPYVRGQNICPQRKKMKLSSDHDDCYYYDDVSEKNEKWEVSVRKNPGGSLMATEKELRELMSYCGEIREIRCIEEHGVVLFHVVFGCELAYQNALLLRSPRVRNQPVYVDSASHWTFPVTIYPLPEWDKTTLQEFLRDFFVRHDIIMSSLRIMRNFSEATFADCRHRARALELGSFQIGDCRARLKCCEVWHLPNTGRPFYVEASLPAGYKRIPYPNDELRRAMEHFNVVGVKKFNKTRFWITLATRADWESAVRRGKFTFRGIECLIKTWHKTPAMIVEGLPAGVSHDALCESVRQFYEQQGAVVMSTCLSSSYPKNILVTFAECAGQQIALNLGKICVNGLILSVRCCRNDHGNV